jgi:hypothetical protein
VSERLFGAPSKLRESLDDQYPAALKEAQSLLY